MTSERMPKPGKKSDALTPNDDQPFDPKVYEAMLGDLDWKGLVAEFEMVVGDAADEAHSSGKNAGKNNDRVRIARRVLVRRGSEAEAKAAAA